jgi:hypothetical protein
MCQCVKSFAFVAVQRRPSWSHCRFAALRRVLVWDGTEGRRGRFVDPGPARHVPYYEWHARGSTALTMNTRAQPIQSRHDSSKRVSVTIQLTRDLPAEGFEPPTP